MLRRAVPLALVLLAAACGSPEEEGTAAPASEATPTAEASPATSAAPTATEAAGGVGPGGYVGRWAAQPNLCTGGAWTFERDRLTTAGEVVCSFREVERSASGWEIAATCTAQAPAEEGRLTITLTDPAPPETMNVSGGPFQSVTLRRCP